MSETPSEATEVVRFWLEEVGSKGWWRRDPALDAEIARRFGELHRRAAKGALDAWAETAEGALALIILLDQFSRNLHRDAAAAFENDAAALALAKEAIARGFDQAIPPPARQFFFLPFEHAEDAATQDACVALILERMPEDANLLRHAEAHRDLIRRFGRFPHRNAALGRESTEAERAHLSGGGYAPGTLPAKPKQ